MARLHLKRYLAVACGFAICNLLIFYVQSPGTSNSKKQQKHHIYRTASASGHIGAVVSEYGRNPLFRDLNSAELYLSSVNLERVDQVTVIYPNFTRRMPRFISHEDERVFMASKVNRENLAVPRSEHLTGEISLFRRASYKQPYDCGYNSNYSYYKGNHNATFTVNIPIIAPLIIPMAFLFQHFMDGTLPKLAQAYGLLMRPDVKILLEKPFHNTIHSLLDRLGISDKVIWHSRGDKNTVYKSDLMISTCITPPLHPALWRKIREMLEVDDHLTVPYQDASIMLLTRSGASNAGRRLLNSLEVEALLKDRYPGKVKVFQDGLHLEKTMELFSKVRLIISPHAGALYNMNFAPITATVVEFVPHLVGGDDIPGLSHSIFWAMADMVGQTYWRVPCLAATNYHDMRVNIKKLSSILDHIDRSRVI